MKTSIIYLASLIVCSLCLTSCGNDNLTDNINLDKSERLMTRSSGDPFEFNEIVTLSTNNCDTREAKTGVRRHVVVEDNMERLVRSSYYMGICGFGDSHILNWGSWYVDVNLTYYPSINAVSGSIRIQYPDYGDEVTFDVKGRPAIIFDEEDSSYQLDMRLTVRKGTGRFEDKIFEGSAIIVDIGSLVTGLGDLRTYLIIEGVMNDRI